MEVQFLNLQGAYRELKSEFDQLWLDTNQDSYYILGKRLEEFEQEFAKYLGVKHVIGVGSGLDALTIGMRALGVASGDEVIVPSFTFIASWFAVNEVGATPVPVDVNSDFLIDPQNIKKAINSKTKAIMPVHMYGEVCQMDKILEIASKFNLKVIEDSAQAHGAYDPKTMQKAGSFGNCSGFSFYPGKNLGCFGDGGGISTNDDLLAEKIRLLRNYGSKVRYEHEIKACNSRLDELQAGVLSIKLNHLDEWNDRRKEIAKLYLAELVGIDDLILPQYSEGHVWHIFSIKTSRRNELAEFLRKNGVGTNMHYPKSIHLQEAYSDMNMQISDFVNAEEICSKVLSLPMGPHLNHSEALYCISQIKEFFGVI
ncbi:DegT/DnrJ/EryC1/StrS family aminotransferase [Rickettsiaceae bacterium]|nr:DegT/DnrJ/EryC1/StrS family aminotransferase [Rickettsiaceae bacterium]